MNSKYIYIILWLISFPVFAQKNITGIVGEQHTADADHDEASFSPLTGANVHWLGTNIGTATDANGYFKLRRNSESNKLIISFIGFKSDTLDISKNDQNLTIFLESNQMLEGVEITHESKGTEMDYLATRNAQLISEKELFKAACCNLSESFETNASVDVAFTDAITGTRQIQMLGLAGTYTQITTENLPSIRGLASNFGLTFIPGSWISSIQVSKGVGSVVNGYESIAGQINTELKKPEEGDQFFLNLYGNQGGRVEANADFRTKIGEKWATAFLLHGSRRPFENDVNQDSFLDFPLTSQLNLVNRWKYSNAKKGHEAQFGIKYLNDKKLGGQVGFEPEIHKGKTDVYGLEINTERAEFFAKNGFVFSPYKSLGMQFSAVSHQQNSYFGLNTYDASQSTIYGNLIYQSIFGTTDHKFKTGLSYLLDNYQEEFNQINYDRTESVLGGFIEYTFNHKQKLNFIMGLRADYHTIFGLFLTPRLHARYEIMDGTVLRASAGRGQRTANIFIENMAVFASSRKVNIFGNSPENPYGLNPEIGWNFGFHLTQDFTLDYREGTMNLDFYRTDFQNQIVVDLDSNPQEISFYNLDGKSYSNSFQAEIQYEILRRVDIKMAYRWLDVRTTYGENLLPKPLTSEHRGFLNLGYTTRTKQSPWLFDLTYNIFGSQRIPNTKTNPENYQMDEFSPTFSTLNFQISKSFNQKLDLYFGGENVLNYTQKNPIISASEPFGDYFDSSLVFAPIFGRTFYGGLRFRIGK